MRRVETPAAAAALLSGRRIVSAELMYRPRPPAGRERLVFDFAFRSRLAALAADDAVLLLCDSLSTLDSLIPLLSDFPVPLVLALIVNPAPAALSNETPRRCAWDDPDGWRRFQTTDRWARIDSALEVGALLGGEGMKAGMLALPAHDAVWRADLLPALRRFAGQHAKAGLPAAVSPYTPFQHSHVPGAAIPREIVDLMNVTLMRDPLLRGKIKGDRVQAFWGKMGLLPFGVCAALRRKVDRGAWEDDLEIDQALRALGYGVRCLWVDDPALYRQSPPVFDLDGLRRVVDRTLHYSLNVGPRASALSRPAAPMRRLAARRHPHFWRLGERSEALIAECSAAMDARLTRFGASWVDWGAYRYVARVSEPYVEVWRHVQSVRTDH